MEGIEQEEEKDRPCDGGGGKSYEEPEERGFVGPRCLPGREPIPTSNSRRVDNWKRLVTELRLAKLKGRGRMFVEGLAVRKSKRALDILGPSKSLFN